MGLPAVDSARTHPSSSPARHWGQIRIVIQEIQAPIKELFNCQQEQERWARAAEGAVLRGWWLLDVHMGLSFWNRKRSSAKCFQPVVFFFFPKYHCALLHFVSTDICRSMNFPDSTPVCKNIRMINEMLKGQRWLPCCLHLWSCVFWRSFLMSSIFAWSFFFLCSGGRCERSSVAGSYKHTCKNTHISTEIIVATWSVLTSRGHSCLLFLIASRSWVAF